LISDEGAASTTDLSDAGLKQTVEDAQTFAKLAPVDVEYLPSLTQQTYKPSQGWIDSTAQIDLPARARQISDAVAQSQKAKGHRCRLPSDWSAGAGECHGTRQFPL
jgi:predicted Zn-dependent protease